MTQEKKTVSKGRNIFRRIWGHENAIIAAILLVIVVALAVITRGRSISTANAKNILLQSSIRGVAAVGEAFVILTGGIDLAVGGLALMSAVFGSITLVADEHSLFGYIVAIPVAIALMLLMGAGVGAFNGFMVSKLRVPSLIVTLGVWQMTKSGAYMLCQGDTIIGLPDQLRFFGHSSIGGVSVSVIIFAVVAATGFFILHYTGLGRSIYAIGGNKVSAWLSGINVSRTLFIVYTISGLLAGLCGLLILSRTMTGSMMALTGLELDAIAAVVVGGISLAGGRGTIIGAVIGAIIIGVINNGMIVIGMDPSIQELVKGSVIVAAVTIDVIRRG